MKKFLSLSLVLLLAGSSVYGLGLNDVTGSAKRLQDLVDTNVPGGEYLSSAVIGAAEALSAFYAAAFATRALSGKSNHQLELDILALGSGAGLTYGLDQVVERKLGVKAKHPNLKNSVAFATAAVLFAGHNAFLPGINNGNSSRD